MSRVLVALFLTLSLNCFGSDILLQCSESLVRSSTLPLKPVYFGDPLFVGIRTKDLSETEIERIQNSKLGCFTKQVRLFGEIRRGDAAMIERVTGLWMKGPIKGVSVYLDSPGGDVYEAIQIGRLFAENDAIIQVDSTCASACVLILAGGPHKLIYKDKAIIAIHRMAFADPEKAASLKREEYRKLYDEGIVLVRAYLQEMGIRQELAEEMMRYSSDEAHILTAQEIRHYGLDQENPYRYEQNKAKWIAKCGQDWWNLSKATEKKALEKCKNEINMLHCYLDMVNPVYKLCPGPLP